MARYAASIAATRSTLLVKAAGSWACGALYAKPLSTSVTAIAPCVVVMLDTPFFRFCARQPCSRIQAPSAVDVAMPNVEDYTGPLCWI